MLALSLRIGEKLLIGEDIEVMVVDIRGGQVKLGTTAPKSVIVDREEVRAKRLIQERGETVYGAFPIGEVVAPCATTPQ